MTAPVDWLAVDSTGALEQVARMTAQSLFGGACSLSFSRADGPWLQFGDLPWVRIEHGPTGLQLRVRDDAGADQTVVPTSFLRSLRAAVQNAVVEPTRRMKELEQLTDADRKHLLKLGRGAPPVAAPRDSVVSRIVACGAAQPEKIALIHQDSAYTYAEVIRHAASLAATLRRDGTGTGDRVLLAMRRSPEAVVGILAVLMTGAAYVPVDPAAPAARLAQIVGQAAPTALLYAGGEFLDGTPAWAGATNCLEVALDHPASFRADEVAGDPGDLAYVLFTSGTTGTPKGVQITQEALAHMCSEICAAYRISEADRVLGFAPLHFDVSVFEIFASLTVGATLCLVNEDERLDPDLLTGLMQRHRVSVAELPPALLPMLDPDELTDLRLLSVGGEAFPGHLVQDWASPDREFWNGYGPTETTVVVTVKRCEGVYYENPPIGRPLGGYRGFVVDEHHRLVPHGAYGELAIAGPCVARGYLGAPELTARQFVPAVDGDGVMYLTGDRVCWRDDADLHFLGRIDRQVKVAGHRIELLEVEAALAAHPAVATAVADVVELNGSPTLIAYYVGETVGLPDLRDFLADALPAYALPARLIPVERIPTTSTGKIDLRALASADHTT
ncbi:amino acid adenylation domain-containing protein [Kribbella sp. NPDC005582]|uniref:amino acid adenylation domain-containing protein n=1 Tax=Kribbella sp. NPDC005582 TaxID=3156893 RepID=UPI0033A99C6F